MKIIAKKKIWNYLIWFGPFLIVAGLTNGLVSGNWGIIPLTFLVLGVIVIVGWLIWQSQKNSWWGRRSTQAGTNALVATMAVLAILALINFLSSRYYLRTDLTEAQFFTLAPQSQQVVRSLTQPIKVWLFAVNQNPLDRELLDNYRRKGSNFSFEYVDPQTRPGLAEKFGVKDVGEVYVESEDKRQLVQVVSDNERLNESKLTNRIQQITTGVAAKAYFLQGHGERPIKQGEGAMSQAVTALESKSFSIEPLNLAEKSQVPEDAAVIIAAGPKRALFDTEVQALRDYLNRGGNLLLMIDPNTDPKLDSLLSEWGVKLDNRLAVDVKGNVALGPAVPIVRDYGQHPITKDFGQGISFYRLARPIQTVAVNGITATPLLKTKSYPDSWAESDLKSEDLKFNDGQDLKGPLTLGVALTRQPSANPTPNVTPTTPKEAPKETPTSTAPPSPQAKATPKATTPKATNSPTPQAKSSPSPKVLATPSPTSPGIASQPTKESRLVVLGNSDFVTDGAFEQMLNGDVFLNSVSWLGKQDAQILSVRPKEPQNRRINLSTAQANILILSSMLILPLLGFSGAGLIWWQRR
jgi:ABC-type uncharacterized transport system involved in gliding motility auxiliary subunit